MPDTATPNATQQTGNPQIVSLDIAIIGGGIAGLWLQNRLQNSGYQTALFESEALGSHQSVGSQGMIHGGIKYTLSGALSGASEAIADMPAHWRACMAGKGDVDLRRAQILSDHFYMWSSASVSSRLTTFFASKATRGRVEKVSARERPAIFQNPQFSGSLYRLVDMVLDVPSVIKALAENMHGRLFQVDWTRARLARDNHNRVRLHLNEQLIVEAKQFVFTAGKGNAELMAQLDITHPQMQIRPLQQVMVKHPYPYRFFGHCLGADKTPRLTISSHPCADGQQVWYLGGSLAEKGATKSAETVINHARKELNTLMPWLDWSRAQYAALPIERAEPRQKNLVRPDKAFAGKAEGVENVLVAWPTKLTLAPNLANEVLARLEQHSITPGNTTGFEALQGLPVPAVASPPWDSAFTRF